MKKNKIIKLIKSFYGPTKLNGEDNNENLKRKLYKTIPTDFTIREISFHKKYKIELSYGLGILGIILTCVSLFYISMSFNSDPFKPTKTVKIEQSDLIVDSFKPTKIIEISDKDRIK